MSVKTSNRLRQVREEHGLAAVALARMVGVSRQTIYSIEDGTYTPNTTVALALARALQVSVEDLFFLDGDASVALGRESPFAEVCRVGDKLVSLPPPASLEYLPTVHDSANAADKVIVAGCDPALSLLASGALPVRAVAANNQIALEWLRTGLVHVAGVHLAEFHKEDDWLAVTFAQWEVGFAYRPGETVVRSFEDLTDNSIRYANREEGAGVRDLLDAGLMAAGIDADAVNGYGLEMRTHLAVAYLVAQGQADCCLTNSAAARFYGLVFTPVREERFDLLVRREMAQEAGVDRMMQKLADKRFRHQLEHLAGYSTVTTGKQQNG